MITATYSCDRCGTEDMAINEGVFDTVTPPVGWLLVVAEDYGSDLKATRMQFCDACKVIVMNLLKGPHGRPPPPKDW